MKTILLAVLVATVAAAPGIAVAQAASPSPQMPTTPSLEKSSDDLSKPAGATRPIAAPKKATSKKATTAKKKTTAKKMKAPKKSRAIGSKHTPRQGTAKHSMLKHHAPRKAKR